MCYHYHYLFDIQIVPNLPPGSPFLSGNTRVFQAYLVLSLSSLGISHFSKELWFLLLKKPRPRH